MAQSVLMRSRRGRDSAATSGRRKSRQAGLSLVELLVALSVSLIGLAGLMSLFTVAARANAVSADTSEAVDLAAGMIEELSTMSVETLEDHPAYAPIDAAGWGPVIFHLGDVAGRRGIEFQRNVYAREVFGSADLVWIKAEVLWVDPGAADDGRDRRIVLERALLRDTEAESP